MLIQPYLYFDGQCEEAIEHYRKALDAEVLMMMRFRESPEGGGSGSPPGDKIMHAALRIGETTIFASDGFATGKPSFTGTRLSLSCSSDAEAARIFAALGRGGHVSQPLEKTFFASSFGMLEDRFGVPWMILVPRENQGH